MIEPRSVIRGQETNVLLSIFPAKDVVVLARSAVSSQSTDSNEVDARHAHTLLHKAAMLKQR